MCIQVDVFYRREVIRITTLVVGLISEDFSCRIKPNDLDLTDNNK